MNFVIQDATRESRKLRLAIVGVAGSGKTRTALELGCGLGKNVIVIDTEGNKKNNGSASIYGKSKNKTIKIDGPEFDFKCLVLPDYSPTTYINALKFIENLGYDVVIIDSLSHAWFGTDGALEQVNKEMARSGNRNSYAAWRNVTPMHNALVQTILNMDAHVICTMRAKERYGQEEDEKGKTKIKKMGIEAIQREGMAYEFDMYAIMDLDHNFIVEKSRVGFDGAVINKPNGDLAKKLLEYLGCEDD